MENESYRAGYTFGLLLARSDWPLPVASIDQFAVSLRPKYPLLISHYRRGLKEGYTMLTSKGRTNSSAKWLKPSQLAECEIRFTIEELFCNEEKWFVKISNPWNVPEDTDMNFETHGDEVLMFSLSRNKSRDSDFEEAKSMLPLDNCYFDTVNLGDDKYFLDLCVEEQPPKPPLPTRPAASKLSPARPATPPKQSAVRPKQKPARSLEGSLRKAGVKPPARDFDPFLDEDDFPS